MLLLLVWFWIPFLPTLAPSLFFVFCFWCLVNVFVTCEFLMLILLNFSGAWIIFSFWVSYFCICISRNWFLPHLPCLIITIIPFRPSFLRWEAIQMWSVQLCGLKPAWSNSSRKAGSQWAEASDLPTLWLQNSWPQQFQKARWAPHQSAPVSLPCLWLRSV